MSEISRREALGTFGALAAAGIGLNGGVILAAEKAEKKDTSPMHYPFSVPALSYDYKALEPFIDEQTMHIHHDKHHGAYVEKLNDALKDHPELHNSSIAQILMKIEEVPEKIRQAVINQGGGHSNHSIFWRVMGPPDKSEPSGALADAIKSTFTDLKTLKEKVNDAAMKRFGSGWSWLLRDKEGKLAVESFANQDSPYSKGTVPIVGVDVWEHAYYLKYQNKRQDYLTAWWNVVNWKEVSDHYAKLHHG